MSGGVARRACRGLFKRCNSTRSRGVQLRSMGFLETPGVMNVSDSTAALLVFDDWPPRKTPSANDPEYLVHRFKAERH